MIKKFSLVAPMIIVLIWVDDSRAQVQSSTSDQKVQQILAAISPDTIRANLTKLVSFGTRNTFSDTSSGKRGIGAARRWIHRTFSRYSKNSGGRLQVSFDYFDQPLEGRAAEETKLSSIRTANVIAMLPGKKDNLMYIVGGHFDSMNGNRYDGTIDAPGANDDGSGTVAIMELARVMSQFEFDHTLMFVAFTGEEQGLWGSYHLAKRAKEEGWQVGGMITNDIVGNTFGGEGQKENEYVRCFSPDPEDSPSRHFARFAKKHVELLAPEMNVEMIFRLDRFGRGGDHRPFTENGFAGIRFTEPNEFFARQHTGEDRLDFVDFDYIARVAKVNATTLACLADAPRSPQLVMINRDPATYETVLTWRAEESVGELQGFKILMRETSERYWQEERMIDAPELKEVQPWGKVYEARLRGRSIDKYVFGLTSIGKNGRESVAATFDLQAAQAWVRAQREKQTAK